MRDGAPAFFFTQGLDRTRRRQRMSAVPPHPGPDGQMVDGGASKSEWPFLSRAGIDDGTFRFDGWALRGSLLGAGSGEAETGSGQTYIVVVVRSACSARDDTAVPALAACVIGHSPLCRVRLEHREVVPPRRGKRFGSPCRLAPARAARRPCSKWIHRMDSATLHAARTGGIRHDIRNRLRLNFLPFAEAFSLSLSLN